MHDDTSTIINQYGIYPRDIYICHSPADSIKAKRLATHLESAFGWTCLYAERNAPPDCADDTIMQMISNCTVFVLISPVSGRHSKTTQFAVSHALALGKNRLVFDFNDQFTLSPSLQDDPYLNTDYKWNQAVDIISLKIKALLNDALLQEEEEPEYDETGERRVAWSFVYLFILLIAVVGGVLTFNSITGNIQIFTQQEAEAETVPNHVLLEIRASQGDADAQYEFGRLQMIVQNFDEGIYWIYHAAKQDHQGAQVYLGVSYRDGNGVEQDYIMAMYWLGRAGFMDSPGMQRDTGWRYLHGVQLPQDYEQALYWFRKAAQQDHVGAQIDLAWMFADGQGVDVDIDEALYWFLRAANLGDITAQGILGQKYIWGWGHIQSYELGIYWHKKAAEQGAAQSMASLGYIYETGVGVEIDFEQAIYWYHQAAEHGNTTAQTNLGSMYYSGRGVMQDYEMAVYWFRKAAQDYGCFWGAGLLGIMYELGYGVTQDYQQAIYWYQRSIIGNAPGWVEERLQWLLSTVDRVDSETP